jgi:hypothetical protein
MVGDSQSPDRNSHYFWLGASADADRVLSASPTEPVVSAHSGDAHLRVIEVEKLCTSQAGITAAFKYALHLQEKGLMRFPAPEWNKPAILVFDGPECVAGINYDVDEDQLRTDIEFAFCSSSHPLALAKALMRFRTILKRTKSETLHFTCHTDNAQMMKAVDRLKLEPFTHSFRIQLREAA